jgi:sigma-E factor negative regulatory protein RseC
MSRMESEIGTVVETGVGRARVEVSQSGICAHCEMASSCVPTSGGKRTIEVLDPVGVSANQRVRIELGSGSLIGASFIGYILPLLGLFAGAAIGFYSALPALKERWGGLGAVAGLAAGLLASRLTGQYFGRRGKLTPTITAVLTDEGGKGREDAD